MGQISALIARLKKEVDERTALKETERRHSVSTLTQHAEVLRKTLAASKIALVTVEKLRSELRSDAESGMDAVFKEAVSAFDASAPSHGLERAIQEVQQEMGRKIEIRLEALNERIRQVATDCARQATAYIPLSASSPKFDLTASTDATQPKDRLAELLNDPVNQLGFMVLAPLSVILLGWVGLVAVPFPFVARLFASDAGSQSADQLRDRILRFRPGSEGTGLFGGE